MRPLRGGGGMLSQMDARVSHRSLAFLVAGAAALLAAACGPGVVLTAEPPDQAVSTALQAVIQSALGQIGSGGSATGQLEQESSARRHITASAGSSSMSFVEYDGHGYVSQDGGAYAELSGALPSSTRLSATDLTTAVAALNFQDQGPATVSGVSTERYSASITLSSLEKLAQALGGSATGSTQLGPMLAMLAPYVTGSGSVDLWLSTRDGSLVRGTLSGSLSVDVGAAASALAGLVAPSSGSASLPTGTLGVSLSLGFDVSDHGGS